MANLLSLKGRFGPPQADWLRPCLFLFEQINVWSCVEPVNVRMRVRSIIQRKNSKCFFLPELVLNDQLDILEFINLSLSSR